MISKSKKIVVCVLTSFIFTLFVLLFLAIRSNGLSPILDCVDVPGKVQYGDSSYIIGSASDFTFPKDFHAGEKITLQFELPYERTRGRVLRIRTYHCAIEVLENGEKIYSYGVERARNRNFVGSGVHHVHLNSREKIDSLQIRLETTIAGNLASMPDVDLLPAPYAISDFFSRHSLALVIGVFMVLFGVLSVLVSMATAFYGVKAYRSFLIGLFSGALGTWTLCYTKLFQMLSFDFALNTSMEYFSLYFGPLPFCLLLMDMRRGKIQNWKWRGILVVVIVGTLFLLVTTILHGAGVLPYPRTLSLFHAYVAIGFLYFLVTGILYGKKLDLSVKFLSFGAAFFGLVAVMDLLRHNVKQVLELDHSVMEMTLIPIGTLVFVLMLVASYLVYLFRLQEVRAEKDFLATVAYADSLTGLFNRAKCQQIFEALDKNAADYALVSCDMNGLKFVNDRFGHQTGDVLIKAFADAFKSAFAGIGTSIRMGGDEFLAIVRQEHLEDLEEAMAKLQKLEKDCPEELPISLEAAYGIAYRHELGEMANSESVYHAADEKMYAMKSKMKSDLVRK